MARLMGNRKVGIELSRLVGAAFPGMRVEVGFSERWQRRCVTFRWPGFSGLLPEERFHRLVRVIPEPLREKQLAGFVWLELTPDETVEDYLKLPRSEDVARHEAEVYASLVRCGFFESLAEEMGARPAEACGGAFEKTATVLQGKKYSPTRTRKVKLVLIRHGAYCDCQVLLAAQPSLAECYPPSR